MLPFYLDPPDPSLFEAEAYLVLDFETTNIEKGDSRNPLNRIVKAAICREGHEPQLVALRKLRKAIPARCVLVAHNAKFELGWLIRQGIDISNMLVWDTMIAEYVIAGNRTVPLDLDSVAKAWDMEGKERIIDALMKGGVCPSEMPEHLLERRVLQDVRTTRDLFLEQRAYLKAHGLLPVMFTRCILTPVLAYIEREGMTLAADRVLLAYDKTAEALAEVTSELHGVTGGINMNSGKQVAAFLYDTLGFDEPKDRRGNPIRTAGGARTTKKEHIESLKARTPEQRKFLDLKLRQAKLAHTLSASLAFFQGVCSEHGGRFVASFNQCRTKTHRLSSSGRKLTFKDGSSRGVQFQNMERDHKSLFKAREDGWLMVEADGSGLEFRIAGDLCHDEQARADILDPDHDPHTFTATVINEIDADAVSKDLRTKAKRHTFKPLFSTGKSGSPSEVAYYQEFKRRYHGITEAQEEWIAEAMRTGQLRIASGLICYWNLTVSRSGFIEHSNEVRNLPIQSFATADIIPVSLVYTFWRSRYTVEAKLVNTVHDSVLAEVAEKDVKAYKDIVVQAFLKDTPKYLQTVYNHAMFVPLGVGITTGPYWGEGEEESIEMTEVT
jgi:DNA polymerase I-like protein with 3'-5' exonuclease and polymerase domains